MSALAGIKVADFSQVMAGPFCTMLLGDLGADVIKVEPPEGDTSRHMGGGTVEASHAFVAVNRNKRGIVLNLKEERGREVARRLAQWADAGSIPARCCRRSGTALRKWPRCEPEAGKEA